VHAGEIENDRAGVAVRLEHRSERRLEARRRCVIDLANGRRHDHVGIALA
jgi:hypothetical protein